MAEFPRRRGPNIEAISGQQLQLIKGHRLPYFQSWTTACANNECCHTQNLDWHNYYISSRFRFLLIITSGFNVFLWSICLQERLLHWQSSFHRLFHIGGVGFTDDFTLAEWVSPIISHWRSGFHRLFHIGGVGFADYFTFRSEIHFKLQH